MNDLHLRTRQSDYKRLDPARAKSIFNFKKGKAGHSARGNVE